MNYSDYSIDYPEYLSYKESMKVEGKLKEIWDDLLNRISEENLKKEAIKKGFEIVDNPDMEDDVIAYYFMFKIPEASAELEKYLEESLYPFLVCLKED
ncbi:MAG: hypothetical protein Q9M91_04665 [Candidatus Dojkabacteria bacterium]|nr:hypothetical protein [Candidatus Dojkabacteria bacterium]MDQ7021104.1 hypothetical protein [Candidatus Dojkabacteria bacterium]